MTELLHKFFKDRKIEYYSVLDYRDCRVISEEIMSRESFTPRSVITYLLPYYAGETVNLSRYAAALDYHYVIKELNNELGELLTSAFPGAHYRGYGDHSPIDERHAAAISGLGIRGDSTLLINEKYGTYVFIADMITDVAPELLGALAPVSAGECIHCGRCLAACPSGVLRKESTACLSAITQRKGELTEEEKNMMRKVGTVWGCDECQSCCPYNANAAQTPIDIFREQRIPNLTFEILDGMTKQELSIRAFAWRGRGVLERNLHVLKENE